MAGHHTTDIPLTNYSTTTTAPPEVDVPADEEAITKVSALPPATFVFLGVVVFILIILLIFFVYINKMLCFKNSGGFSCIEQAPPKKISSTKSKRRSRKTDKTDKTPIIEKK